MTYQVMLDEVRRATALRLLRGNEVEVSEVAFLLGFEELNSFTRSFRQWEGLTPTQYRTQRGVIR